MKVYLKIWNLKNVETKPNSHAIYDAIGRRQPIGALLITDFVDQKGNGNYEQMGRSGSKEKNDKAVDILVDETLDRLKNLSTRQAKGYM